MNIIEKLGGATRLNLTLMILALIGFNFVALWIYAVTGNSDVFKITFAAFGITLSGLVTYFYQKSNSDAKTPVVDNNTSLQG